MIAITGALFVFIEKCYRRVRVTSTTRPEDFLVPLKDGSRLPLQREERNRGQRLRLVAFRGENRFRIGTGHLAYRDPAKSTDKRAN